MSRVGFACFISKALRFAKINKMLSSIDRMSEAAARCSDAGATSVIGSSSASTISTSEERAQYNEWNYWKPTLPNVTEELRSFIRRPEDVENDVCRVQTVDTHDITRTTLFSKNVRISSSLQAFLTGRLIDKRCGEGDRDYDNHDDDHVFQLARAEPFYVSDFGEQDPSTTNVHNANHSSLQDCHYFLTPSPFSVAAENRTIKIRNFADSQFETFNRYIFRDVEFDSPIVGDSVIAYAGCRIIDECNPTHDINTTHKAVKVVIEEEEEEGNTEEEDSHKHGFKHNTMGNLQGGESKKTKALQAAAASAHQTASKEKVSNSPRIMRMFTKDGTKTKVSSKTSAIISTPNSTPVASVPVPLAENSVGKLKTSYSILSQHPEASPSSNTLESNSFATPPSQNTSSSESVFLDVVAASQSLSNDATMLERLSDQVDVSDVGIQLEVETTGILRPLDVQWREAAPVFPSVVPSAVASSVASVGIVNGVFPDASLSCSDVRDVESNSELPLCASSESKQHDVNSSKDVFETPDNCIINDQEVRLDVDGENNKLHEQLGGKDNNNGVAEVVRISTSVSETSGVEKKVGSVSSIEVFSGEVATPSSPVRTARSSTTSSCESLRNGSFNSNIWCDLDSLGNSGGVVSEELRMGPPPAVSNSAETMGPSSSPVKMNSKLETAVGTSFGVTSHLPAAHSFTITKHRKITLSSPTSTPNSVPGTPSISQAWTPSATDSVFKRELTSSEQALIYGDHHDADGSSDVPHMPRGPVLQDAQHNLASSSLRRHSSYGDVPFADQSNVLRKVASLTLDRATIEERVNKPKFVPAKLDFRIYKKFEGIVIFLSHL